MAEGKNGQLKLKFLLIAREMEIVKELPLNVLAVPRPQIFFSQTKVIFRHDNSPFLASKDNPMQDGLASTDIGEIIDSDSGKQARISGGEIHGTASLGT